MAASDALSHAQFVRLFEGLTEDLVSREEDLRALDAALGDGDLGITVRAGFNAACKSLGGPPLNNAAAEDIGAALAAAGPAFMNANGSTMGTLMGTALMRAGKAVRGQTSLNLADAARMCRAAAEGIQQRGKAKLGDKTILDALFPAVEALEAAEAEGGVSCAQAFLRAAGAAQTGVDHTTPLQSQVSRASWLQERSKGRPDPGASLCTMIFVSLAHRLSNPQAN